MTLMFMVVLSSVSFAWFDTDYFYRQNITASITSETMVDMPNKIIFNSSWFNYSRADAIGKDILFTVQNGTTEYQIYAFNETWNTSGNSIIWVNVPQLLNTSNKTIWVYYGNVTPVSTQFNISRTFSNGSTGYGNDMDVCPPYFEVYGTPSSWSCSNGVLTTEMPYAGITINGTGTAFTRSGSYGMIFEMKYSITSMDEIDLTIRTANDSAGDQTGYGNRLTASNFKTVSWGWTGGHNEVSTGYSANLVQGVGANSSSVWSCVNYVCNGAWDNADNTQFKGLGWNNAPSGGTMTVDWIRSRKLPSGDISYTFGAEQEYVNDTTAPNVTIVAPAVNYYVQYNSSGVGSWLLNFTYTVTDNVLVSNCSLYVNDSLVQSGLVNYTNVNVSTLANVSYYIECFDTSSNYANSTLAWFFVNTTNAPVAGNGSSSNYFINVDWDDPSVRFCSDNDTLTEQWLLTDRNISKETHCYSGCVNNSQYGAVCKINQFMGWLYVAGVFIGIVALVVVFFVPF
jgi:hypothetical protein